MKLTYFELSGSRGEECRIALHLAGVPWEDERIGRAEWMARKPHTPWGGLPTLDVDGTVIGQSNAILTYVGRRYGLHPADLLEAARHEGVLAACEELRCSFSPALRASDPDEKRALREAFVAGELRRWATHCERQVRGPFVGGSEINVADAKLFIMVRWFRMGVLDHIPTGCLDGFAGLVGLQAAVEGHPAVAEWLAQSRS